MADQRANFFQPPPLGGGPKRLKLLGRDLNFRFPSLEPPSLLDGEKMVITVLPDPHLQLLVVCQVPLQNRRPCGHVIRERLQ
jgi:hypothetical protein